MNPIRLAGIAAAGILLCAQATASIDKGPYLQNPTTSSVTVCWVTASDCKGSVSYGAASSDEKTVKEEKPATVHKVRITGLKPYTRYRYMVDCDGQKEGGSFLTAAEKGTDFHFAVYGDNRTDPAAHAVVLARMLEFKPDFIIQTGDIVANGTMEDQWTEFFKVAHAAMLSTPYMAALGNHEKNGAPYFRYFDVPREYSFDYGSIHFTALDSNRPESEHADQEARLKKDLAAHQDATWRVVYFHHTPYTCVTKSGRRELAEKLRARLEPIFLAGHVQLVLNGHDHDYQHHLARGIHYVVTGGGGAPLYEVIPDTPFVKSAKMAHHYCDVRVEGSKLSILAREPDGSVIEQFQIP